MADVTMVLYGQNASYGINPAHTFKAALFTSTYVPDQDTDTAYTTLTGELANGNGYTTGGNACNNPVLSYDDTLNSSIFDADNPAAWTFSADKTFRYIVFYDEDDDVLEGYIDLEEDTLFESGSSAVFAFNPSGVLAYSVPAA